MAAPNNTYTSVSISGYDASPPPDDGTVSSDNKVEWAKHKEKLGDPIKTMAETMDTNISAAVGTLIVTDDPGQETSVIFHRMFS